MLYVQQVMYIHRGFLVKHLNLINKFENNKKNIAYTYLWAADWYPF